MTWSAGTPRRSVPAGRRAPEPIQRPSVVAGHPAQRASPLAARRAAASDVGLTPFVQPPATHLDRFACRAALAPAGRPDLRPTAAIGGHCHASTDATPPPLSASRRRPPPARPRSRPPRAEMCGGGRRPLRKPSSYQLDNFSMNSELDGEPAPRRALRDNQHLCAHSQRSAYRSTRPASHSRGTAVVVSHICYQRDV